MIALLSLLGVCREAFTSGVPYPRPKVFPL